MTYDNNSFCAFIKRTGDINTITYPFANGERVIIQRTYSDEGIAVFSEIRIEENGERTISVLPKEEMNDDIFDRTREMLVEMYHKDENKDIRFLKHTLNIDEVTDDALTVQSVEDDYIEEETRREDENTPLAETFENAMAILNACLTEKQKRRYLKKHFEKKDERTIAIEEGITQMSVWESLQAANKQIKKYFLKKSKKHPVKTPKKSC